MTVTHQHHHHQQQGMTEISSNFRLAPINLKQPSPYSYIPLTRSTSTSTSASASASASIYAPDYFLCPRYTEHDHSTQHQETIWMTEYTFQEVLAYVLLNVVRQANDSKCAEILSVPCEFLRHCSHRTFPVMQLEYDGFKCYTYPMILQDINQLVDIYKATYALTEVQRYLDRSSRTHALKAASLVYVQCLRSNLKLPCQEVHRNCLNMALSEVEPVVSVPMPILPSVEPRPGPEPDLFQAIGYTLLLKTFAWSIKQLGNYFPGITIVPNKRYGPASFFWDGCEIHCQTMDLKMIETMLQKYIQTGAPDNQSKRRMSYLQTAVLKDPRGYRRAAKSIYYAVIVSEQKRKMLQHQQSPKAGATLASSNTEMAAVRKIDQHLVVHGTPEMKALSVVKDQRPDSSASSKSGSLALSLSACHRNQQVVHTPSPKAPSRTAPLNIVKASPMSLNVAKELPVLTELHAAVDRLPAGVADSGSSVVCTQITPPIMIDLTETDYEIDSADLCPPKEIPVKQEARATPEVASIEEQNQSLDTLTNEVEMADTVILPLATTHLSSADSRTPSPVAKKLLARSHPESCSSDDEVPLSKRVRRPASGPKLQSARNRSLGDSDEEQDVDTDAARTFSMRRQLSQPLATSTPTPKERKSSSARPSTGLDPSYSQEDLSDSELDMIDCIQLPRKARRAEFFRLKALAEESTTVGPALDVDGNCRYCFEEFQQGSNKNSHERYACARNPQAERNREIRQAKSALTKLREDAESGKSKRKKKKRGKPKKSIGKNGKTLNLDKS